jgi:hypothetical protein
MKYECYIKEQDSREPGMDVNSMLRGPDVSGRWSPDNEGVVVERKQIIGLCSLAFNELAVTKSDTQNENAGVSAAFSIDVLFFNSLCPLKTCALSDALPGLKESSAKGAKGLVKVTILKHGNASLLVCGKTFVHSFGWGCVALGK